MRQSLIETPVEKVLRRLVRRHLAAAAREWNVYDEVDFENAFNIFYDRIADP